MSKLDYTERLDSGKYYVRVNKKHVFPSEVAEITKIDHFQQTVTGTLSIDQSMQVTIIELVARGEEETIAFIKFPFALIVDPGDTLTVTYQLNIKISKLLLTCEVKV